MRHQKPLLLLVVILCSAIPIFAQSEHKPEIYLGYSNLQAQGLPDQNDVTGIFGSNFLNSRTTLHGFNSSVTGFLTDSVGLTGDFSFNENNRSNTDFFGTTSMKTDIFYFMGGPTVRIGHSNKIQPFAHFLAGGAHTRFDVSEQDAIAGNFTTSFKTGTTDFALGAGGGLDWRVGDRLKVRLFQVDYTPVFLRDQSIQTLTDAGAINPFTLNGQRMDNFRFGFGIVF
jgi:hypothetical protein